MLRTARSLPSLKGAVEATIKRDIQQQSKNFSSITSRYNLVVPNIPDHQLSTDTLNRYQTMSRSVHQSAKNNATTLFSQKTSEFSVMSLNSLKGECRKRGLKISGRKADLVSRISTYDQSFSTKKAGSISTKTSAKKPTKQQSNIVKKNTKSFTTSSKRDAKGDDSTIDFIKPVDLTPPKLVEDDYIVQIPSLSTEASAKPVTKLEKQLSEASVNDPNVKVVSKADGSDAKIYEQSSLNKIEKQNEDAFNTDASDIIDEVPEQPYEYEKGDVPSKDKTLFAGVFAVVAGWWFLKPKSEKKH